jgi:ABC-type uncharacterized transport system substrate-binding protein
VKRREFISLLGGAAAAWPIAARAQQAERVRRIGVLPSLEESDPEGRAQLSGFTQGLAELGWIEGRNLRMEIRRGGGDVDRIRTFAKDLVALQPDVIVAQAPRRLQHFNGRRGQSRLYLWLSLIRSGMDSLPDYPTQAGMSPAS